METPAQEVPTQSVSRIVLLPLALGVVAATAASVFITIVDEGQHLLFVTLPAVVGLDTAPWWWMWCVLLVGALLVMAARRMPGHSGPSPLTGFHFDLSPRSAPSILLAALGTLAFGFALGPEAPLIVLGSAIGAMLMSRAAPAQRRAGMLLGGIAAIGAVFGNPFVTGFMVLEFAALGTAPAAVILPTFIALAGGYLTQLGISNIPGFGLHALSVPGLPTYDAITFPELALAIGVALVAGVVAAVVRESAVALDRFVGQRWQGPLIGAAITAVVLAVGVTTFDLPVDQILFSGSGGMADLVQQTAVLSVIVILLFKAVVYCAALGTGFRGGPIFPATFLGVAVGVLVALLVPGISVTPLAAAGIAATAAAMTRLPATSALLAALLVTGGAAVAPVAILGSAVGFLVRTSADRVMSRHAVNAPQVANA